MKCPYCGAETGNNICPYCGREISDTKYCQDNLSDIFTDEDDQDEFEIICYNCGSNKIRFKREKTGIYGESSRYHRRYYSSGNSRRKYTYHTVAICQKCGNTWEIDYEEEPKHNFGWWFLAIVFFPITLPILFITSDEIKIDKAIRLFIVLVSALIIISKIKDYRDSNLDRNKSKVVNIVQSTSSIYNNIGDKIKSESQTPVITIEPSATSIIYTDDGILNQFITDYNAITKSKFSDLSNGKGRKIYAKSYDYYCTLLHSSSTDKINVTISGTSANGDKSVSGMRDIFHDVVLAIDPLLSDEDVYDFFDIYVQKEYFKEENALGTMTITIYRGSTTSSGDYNRGYINIEAQ